MLQSEHITGICESAGSFSFSLQKGARPNITPSFSLKTSTNNISLALEIQEFFGGGRIYRLPDKDQVFFRITTKKHLLRIVSHFDIHPLVGEKRKAFEVWRTIVLEKQRPPSKQNKPALFQWANSLSLLNQRTSRSTLQNDKEYRPYG